MSKTKLDIFEYEGKKITFDFGDGEEMINATEIAKQFNKKLDNFSRLKQTKDFIKALESSMNPSKPSHVRVWKKAIKSIRGGTDPSLRGTWYEKRLALKLAAWINPNFEVWIFTKIEALLTNGQTSLSEDKIVIDKKTFEFFFEKNKETQNSFNHFLESLINSSKEQKH